MKKCFPSWYVLVSGGYDLLILPLNGLRYAPSGYRYADGIPQLFFVLFRHQITNGKTEANSYADTKGKIVKEEPECYAEAGAYA